MKEQRELAEYVLLLDTGDALVAEGAESQTLGEDVVAGMNLMAYDAMALGPLELGLGAEVVRQRLDEAEFPMLSANVLWSADLTPVADPYTILEVGTYRIGVIGLTRHPDDDDLPDYEILDPKEVLAQLVPQVDDLADIVVLLANLTYRSAAGLAEAFPDIDLVIAALPQQLPTSAVRIPQTGALIVTADQPLPAHSGRRVGKLVVVLEIDGALHDERWVSTPMGPEIIDDPDMRALLYGFSE